MFLNHLKKKMKTTRSCSKSLRIPITFASDFSVKALMSDITNDSEEIDYIF